MNWQQAGRLYVNKNRTPATNLIDQIGSFPLLQMHMWLNEEVDARFSHSPAAVFTGSRPYFHSAHGLFILYTLYVDGYDHQQEMG